VIWVVDASVALRWLLRGEEHPGAQAVLESMLAQPLGFAVPELFMFEVYAVLCKLHPKAGIAFQTGVIPVLRSGVMRHPMTRDLASYAARFVDMGLTGHDACYAGLAALLKGTWLTFDSKAHARIKAAGLSHDLNKGLPSEWPPSPATA